MKVYRIATKDCIRDLSGKEAEEKGGRWNPPGLACLYTSESRALAILESLVHLPDHKRPRGMHIAVINIPDSVKALDVKLSVTEEDVKSAKFRKKMQRIGEKWLADQKFALLKVPSVIIPEEKNILVNPLHPESKKITLSKVRAFRFDERLF
jgi:RES domain-containing protein